MPEHQAVRLLFAFAMRAVLPGLECLLPALLLAICAGRAACQPPVGGKQPKHDGDVATLIDELKQVADADVGYMATRSGGAFPPLGTSQAEALLLGQKLPVTSGTLRNLVERGVAAVPTLVAHLGDKRPTRITVHQTLGFGGLFFADEYDYNSRTAQGRPEGVNGDRWRELRRDTSYTLTVGDLCFVALGQIVNRRFSAMRYQPTACIVINTPSGSEVLRKATVTEWGALTPGRHKESLVRDFVQPDYEGRRIGACLRLGYYYPQALEPLALKQLAAPMYDSIEIEALVREKLYPEKDARRRRACLDAFVTSHGEVAREGCLLQLFRDLSIQEAEEEARTTSVAKERYAARACLVELYGYPKLVKSHDQPRLLPTNNAMQARLVDALRYFPSPRVDAAVRAVLHSTDDSYLANACMRYLAGGGADRDIQQYVERRSRTGGERRRRELRGLLERVGWTRLHVAAEVGEPATVEKLIRDGADVNARAANGRTPLHVAAQYGSYGAVDCLLRFKADPNVRDKEGRTPIQLGIGYRSVVYKLLAAGGEPCDIFLASLAGRADLVRAYLAKDPGSVRRTTSDGQTALHFAAREGHAQIAQLLLARRAQVDALDSGRVTPLHLAALYARPDLIELLLAHSADPHAKTSDGKTALDLARESGDRTSIRLLETNR